MPFVTTADGARLWFEVRTGSDQTGMPLVLVQGRALDHHGWDLALGDFGERTLVLLDHRGTGESDDAFTTDWSTSDFAADVAAVLDAAGIERAHVYGHSMGGRIGQWLAAEHPHRVVALVLGAAGVGDGLLPRPAAGAAALASGDPTALAALFYPDAWIAEHPGQAGSVLPAARSTAALRTHAAASERADGPAPETITAPTLVLHGDADAVTDPESARVLAERIPNARLAMLPGARHAYFVGDPEAHERVRAFLAAHDA